MKKFLTIFAAAALMLAAVASCSKDEKGETEIPLKGITVAPTSLDLFVGDTGTLTVTYAPVNATNKPKVEWTSSADAVATVSAEGVVTAVAPGEATITAKADKFTATATVKVSNKDDYTGPVQGTSAWSVIGAFLETNWDTDFVCDEADGIFFLKNVRLLATDQFKFRKDKAWDENRGAAGDTEPFVVSLEAAIEAVAGGKNLAVANDGLYDLYYNANLEQIAVVSKDGTPNWNEPQLPPEGDIKIDGDFADWADIPGVSKGTHGMFKFAMDENYVYLHTYRTREGRFDALWGDGAGYIYFAFELDGDATTGETLNDNGPWDYIGFIYCFGGSAEAPEVKITAAGDCRPSDYTVANVKVAGTVDESGAYVEYSIPRSDLPELPAKFSVTSWGNKDLDKVTITVPYEAPEPPVDWDYTPSAEYTDASNLWKAVDAANTTEWFYNPEWAGEQEPPVTTFKESTWEIWNKVATTDSWQAQLWIHPTNDLLLDVGKKYTFSCSVYATAATPVYLKMYQKGVDAALSCEVPRATIPAGTLINVKVEDFVPLATPQCILIDFGGIPANTKVFVKDIVLKVTGEVAPPVTWDYTPGDEYLADNNIWKAKAAGHEKYYYYNATGGDWNGSDILSTTVPFLTVNQSTYELDYPEATNELWQKQFFIFPDAGNEIALAADKTYKVKVTLGTNQPTCPGFFKFSKFDAGNTTKHEGATIWEKGNVTLAGAEPLVIESPELTGVECENILFVFAFGGNPAETKVYIKDITLVEVGGETPSGITVTDALRCENGTEVTIKDALVAAKTTKGIIITDGNKAVYVYGNQVADVKVGDIVVLSAKKTTYNGVHELDTVTAVEVKSSGNEVVYPAPTDITPDALEYTNDEAEFVSLTGTLAKSGNYYNLNLEGTTDKLGSIVYPVAELNADSFDGKKITIYGYFNGLSGGGKYINIVTVKIEEVTIPGSDGDIPDYDPITGFEW